MRALALAVLVIAPATACADVSTTTVREARIARVADGDTVVLSGGARVRLLQIDAPEPGRECYAEAARRELSRLAPPGTRVALETDARLDEVDRFGRLLRYVRVGATNVNIELVRRGAATPYFFGGDRGRHAARLLTAVAEARAARRGLWGSCRVTWSPTRPVETRPR